MKIIFKNTSLSLVSSKQWKSAIKKSTLDSSVGIIHASLSGDMNNRIHVAQIPKKVGCHVHFKGDEDYLVVQGRGILHWGKVSNTNSIQWENPIEVEIGSNFIIPEGCAHQLQSIGDEKLIILFSCPDSHLNDRQDRTMLEDSPFL